MKDCSGWCSTRLMAQNDWQHSQVSLGSVKADLRPVQWNWTTCNGRKEWKQFYRKSRTVSIYFNNKSCSHLIQELPKESKCSRRASVDALLRHMRIRRTTGSIWNKILCVNSRATFKLYTILYNSINFLLRITISDSIKLFLQQEKSL